MTTGKISKLVATFGSTWGRIEPDGQTRSVFFNPAALIDEDEYAGLEVGQLVEFDEELDRASGTHAVRVRRIVPSAS